MTHYWQILLISLSIGLTSCGDKKAPVAPLMSEKYPLEVFADVDNPSTLDLEKLKDLPRTVDLKEIMTSVKQQDERGTCSFFTAIALAESAIKKKMKVDVNLSEEYLNNAVKTSGDSADQEGGSTLNNLYFAIVMKKGFLLERDWPYQPTWFAYGAPCENYSPNEEAPAKCFAHNSPGEDILSRKIPAENFQYYTLKVEDTNDFIKALAEYRQPISISLPVNRKGWADNGDVAYTEDHRKECIETPSSCGFHAVVVTGYDLEKKVLFFKNSWGKEWGHEGYGTLPLDVLDRHVRRKFVVLDLDKDIELPEDHQKEYLVFNDFNATPVLKQDGSIQVDTFADLSNVGFHTMAISSYLVELKSDANGQPDRNNTELIELSEGDKAIYNTNYVSDARIFYAEKEFSEAGWKSEAPVPLTLDGKLMQSSTVSRIHGKSSVKTFIRTTLYKYTDDSSYKVIKSTFIPINN